MICERTLGFAVISLGNSYDTLRVDVSFSQDVFLAVPASGSALNAGNQIGVAVSIVRWTLLFNQQRARNQSRYSRGNLREIGFLESVSTLKFSTTSMFCRLIVSRSQDIRTMKFSRRTKK